MTTPMTAEQLADAEAICRLKYQLLRGIDVHDVELVMRCFAADAEVDFGGAYVASGWDAIGKLFASILVPGWVSSHVASHPEIEFESGSMATGVWKFESTSLSLDEGSHRYSEQYNAGYYRDNYAKHDGWLLTRSSNTLTYSIREPVSQPRTGNDLSPCPVAPLSNGDSAQTRLY